MGLISRTRRRSSTPGGNPMSTSSREPMVNMICHRRARIIARAEMGKTPTSPAGRAAPVNGWSLIELLVVLSIVGAVSSLALPSLRDSIPSLRLSAEARQIVVLFREAQRRAVESGQETAVQVDLADYT